MSTAKGPQVPAQPRTLRGIALSKGTTPSGFVQDLVPEDAWSGQYADRAEAAKPPVGAAVRESDPQPSPFKVGG